MNGRMDDEWTMNGLINETIFMNELRMIYWFDFDSCMKHNTIVLYAQYLCLLVCLFALT
jgi:hypothetical protein